MLTYKQRKVCKAADFTGYFFGKLLCFIGKTLYFAEEGHGGAAWLSVPSSDGRNTHAEVDAQSANQWHSGRL